MPLRLSRKLSVNERQKITRALEAVPGLAFPPILIECLPDLTAYRGKLLSGQGRRGVPVYAASFIRGRRVVLEASLLSHPTQLRLILVHELFHFIWPRLSRRTRAEYEALLISETEHGARGELGESASGKKDQLRLRRRGGEVSGSLWKDYLCESFCDTAAWCFAGVRQHAEFTLAPRWRRRRASWLASAFPDLRVTRVK